MTRVACIIIGGILAIAVTQTSFVVAETIYGDVGFVEDPLVDGGAINGDLAVNNDITLQTGGTIATTSDGDLVLAPNGTGITAVGANNTSQGLSGGDDLFVNGKLEVDGLSYFDVKTSMSQLDVSANANFGGSYIAFYPQGDDGIHVTTRDVDGQGNNNIIITTLTNRQKDHDHETLSDNPTVWVHSATDPDTDNTQWLSLFHDQTDAQIATGKGGVVLAPAAQYLVLPSVLSATPAEPVACGAGYDGAQVYVDDTDDTSYGRVCVCANLDGTGYDWRDIGDIVGTACPFF